jgi:hypothetical protein
VNRDPLQEHVATAGSGRVSPQVMQILGIASVRADRFKRS